MVFPQPAIVIAAYNEGRKLGEVLDRLHRAGYHKLIVIDDGSSDKTSDIAQAHGAVALRHFLNRGQGAALRTGVEYALRTGAQYIIHFDADGQHDIKDIPAMMRPVVKGEVDVTLGSRFVKNGMSNAPYFRRLMLKGGAFLLNVLYGTKLTDSHNGFRCFSRKAAEAVDFTSDRMEHASEIPELIVKKQLRYREIPVNIQYTEYSKAHSSQGFLPAVRILFRMFIHKLSR